MRLPPPRRLAAVLGAALLGAAVLGAALLLSSCPRAGIMPFGVEVSEEGGGSAFFKSVTPPEFDLSNAEPLNQIEVLHLSTSSQDAYILYCTEADALPDRLYVDVDGIPLDGFTVVRARTMLNSAVGSPTVERIYSFKLPPPVFDPPSLTSPGVVNISSLAGSTVYYSALNLNLNSSTSSFPHPVDLSSGKTLTAEARKSGWATSEQVSLTVP